MVGQRAPALPAAGWVGGTRPDRAGKPYLIHFWATWCGPCKGDLPQLKRLAKAGATIVGIHPPGTPADEVATFIDGQKLGYPTLLEAGEKYDPKAPKIGGYPTGVFPHCVVVDGRGRVAAHGMLSEVVPILERQTRLMELGRKPAPLLAAREWLQPAAALTLDGLKGKVVLLDFWGQWCGPCVAKLPRTEELHQQFKDRGLVVVGVHSVRDSDKLAEFLKEKKVTFPVMIDRGETAERYAVDAWPRYFLIDRTGKVVWGMTHEPPSAAQIEELLGK